MDTHRATIYVTGSSSKMLSSEIATEFRGRALDFELLPLSFAEFLSFNDMAVSAQAGYSTAERIALEKALGDYLRQGGFPAAQGLPAQEAVPLLQSYVQRVVARDVIERHNLAKPRVAASFAQRLMGLNGRQLSIRKVANDLRSAGIATSRELLGDLLGYLEDAYLLFVVRERALNGRQLSIRKVANDLRSAGIATSRELLGDLLGYLEDAYLLFVVRERAYSLAESTNSTPKAYVVDPGLALASGRASTNDAGQRLEDAVYLELRRRAPGMRKEAITSLRTSAHGYEVDFALGDALDERPLGLFQVCASTADEGTLGRELRALWEALDEHGLEEGTLIAGDGPEATYEQGGRVIRQVPAWRWFLEG